MSTFMLDHLKHFLSLHHIPGRPVLLGFSGGPDSLALLHLLLECKMDLDLHIAHVDHGWRLESSAEAEQLKSDVEPHFLSSEYFPAVLNKTAILNARHQI